MMPEVSRNAPEALATLNLSFTLTDCLGYFPIAAASRACAACRYSTNDGCLGARVREAALVGAFTC